jgi:hypothetical protein
MEKLKEGIVLVDGNKQISLMQVLETLRSA